MTHTMTTAIPPSGYRFMQADEADRLQHRAVVELLYGSDVVKGTVKGFGDATMNVLLDRSRAIVTLDLDDPDYWPDGEVRDRRPPMSTDGEFVALRNLNADETDLVPALKASARLAIEEEVERIKQLIAIRQESAA